MERVDKQTFQNKINGVGFVLQSNTFLFYCWPWR